MDFKIREANKTDVFYINEIKNYYIINTNYNVTFKPKTIEEAEQWFDECNGNYPILVGEYMNSVIGYASLSSFRKYDGYILTAEVSVYVDKDYLGRGFGKKLLAELEKYAKKYNFHCLVSVIISENTQSIKLHENNGYNLIGIMKEAAHKDNKFIDIVFMSKLI